MSRWMVKSYDVNNPNTSITMFFKVACDAKEWAYQSSRAWLERRRQLRDMPEDFYAKDLEGKIVTFPIDNGGWKVYDGADNKPLHVAEVVKIKLEDMKGGDDV